MLFNQTNNSNIHFLRTYFSAVVNATYYLIYGFASMYCDILLLVQLSEDIIIDTVINIYFYIFSSYLTRPRDVFSFIEWHTISK